MAKTISVLACQHNSKKRLKNLEKSGLVISANYNKLKIDRTKWYRIDYGILETLENTPLHNICTTNSHKWYEQITQHVRPLPETNTKIINIDKHDYIILSNDEHMFSKIYLSIYSLYMYDKHPTISKDNYTALHDWYDMLTNYDIDKKEFYKQVLEHFENLPESNNGSIISFMKASKRYFDLSIEYDM